MSIQEDTTNETSTDEAFDEAWDEEDSSEQQEDALPAHDWQEAGDEPDDGGNIQANAPPAEARDVSARKPEQKKPAGNGVPAEPQQGEQDYKTLYESAQQQMRSWNGRLSQAAAMIKEREQEIARLKTLVEQGGGDHRTDSGKPDTQAAPGDNALGDPALTTEQSEQFERAFKDDYGVSMPRYVSEAANKVAERLFQERMTPLIREFQEMQLERHLQAIGAAHSDFMEIRDNPDLRVWVQSKPPDVAMHLDAVLRQGSAAEVIEALTSYKQDRGIKTVDQRKQDRDAVVRRASAVRKSSPGVPKDVSSQSFDEAWNNF